MRYNWHKKSLTIKQKAYIAGCYEKQASGVYSQILKDFNITVTGKRAVDIGCGPGHWLKEFVKYKPALTAGMDMDIKFLKEARKRLSPCVFLIRGTGDYLPFKSENFDIVLSILVIPYIKNEKRCFSELYRILNPGGLLLISGHGFGFPLRYLKKCRFSPLIIYFSTFLYFISGRKLYLNTLQSIGQMKRRLVNAGFLIEKMKISKKTFFLPETYTILCRK